MSKGFRISGKGMRALRKLLWQTHRLDDGTDIVVVAGSDGPQYAGEQGKEAVMTVGLKWLETNHPQAFVEAISQRLKGGQ